MQTIHHQLENNNVLEYLVIMTSTLLSLRFISLTAHRGDLAQGGRHNVGMMGKCRA